MVTACTSPCWPHKFLGSPHGANQCQRMSTTDHGFQCLCTLPSPSSLNGMGIALVSGRYCKFFFTSCELNCWRFILFSGQNKMVLAWAALSFPLQNTNDLTTRRSNFGEDYRTGWFWEPKQALGVFHRTNSFLSISYEVLLFT